MFLGLVLRDPRGLAPLLANYRKEYREVLQMEDVMRKLGAEVSGLETVLAVEGRIVLVGHDGEPVFTLSAS